MSWLTYGIAGGRAKSPHLTYGVGRLPSFAYQLLGLVRVKYAYTETNELAIGQVPAFALADGPAGVPATACIKRATAATVDSVPPIATDNAQADADKLIPSVRVKGV